VETPAVPIDASPAKGLARPVSKLQITQTLDERQADKGKLILEVKATGLGLVPALDQVLDVAPEGFEVVKVDDQGVSVGKFDQDSPETAVVSDRNILVHLLAREGVKPTHFRFGKPKVEVAQMTYQRYQDADLVNVKEEVELEQAYGKRRLTWLWAAAAAAVALVLVAAGVFVLLRKRPPAEARRFRLPERLTPFTVLGLLRQIQANNGLGEAQQRELAQSISQLERRYFADDGNGEVDLRAMAEEWVSRAK
jgi:hypothetical protein